MSAWEKGKKEPHAQTACHAEELLDVAPGGLTRHLGYLPLAAAGEVIECTVADAILSDPGLSDGQRRAMLGTYREFTRGG